MQVDDPVSDGHTGRREQHPASDHDSCKEKIDQEKQDDLPDKPPPVSKAKGNEH